MFKTAGRTQYPWLLVPGLCICLYNNTLRIYVQSQFVVITKFKRVKRLFEVLQELHDARKRIDALATKAYRESKKHFFVRFMKIYFAF